jgi:hypothetical protein
MRIICLANSYKHNDRCIAGVDDTGRWVRPVSFSRKRAIDKETRIINGPFYVAQQGWTPKNFWPSADKKPRLTAQIGFKSAVLGFFC